MMNQLHYNLKKRYNWYQNWHQSTFSSFIHWFVFIVFIATVTLHLVTYFQPVEAAGSFTVDSEANWAAGSHSSTEADGSGNLRVATNSDWYDTDWAYRKKITIDKDEVDADLTDFPVLINQATDTDLAAEAQADFDDVLFTDSAGSKLSHQIENYNSGTGLIRAWVKADLTDASDTDLYMYYGNDSCGSQESVNDVWSNDYLGMWLLNEGSGTDASDYTGNGYDGTLTGMDPATDWETYNNGYALDFQAATEYVTAGALPVFNSITWGGWASADVETTLDGFAGNANNASQGVAFFTMAGDQWRIQVWGANGKKEADVDPGATKLGWHYWVVSYNSTNGETYLYRDGVAIGPVTLPAGTVTSANDWQIGRWPINRNDVGWNGTVASSFIASRVFSAEEISTQYNNQSNPATFYSLDSEVSAYSAASGSFSSDIKDMSYNQELTNFSVIETLPAGTSTDYFVRTGPTASPDGSWTGWVSVSDGVDPDSSLDDNQYLQIRADLTSDGDQTASPLIDSMTVDYQSVAPSSTITSPANGSTFGSGNITVEGTIADNNGAPIEKIEISTNNGSSWSDILEAGWPGIDTWDSWQYRKKITINSDQVDTDLTDFPVLVSLDSDTGLKDNAQADADDILFTSSAGTQLSHQIENYDSSDGSLRAWVKIPTLSQSSDTELYIYYGNGSVGSQENVTDVWSNSFEAVWLMNEGSGTTINDYTSNGYDGTMINMDPATQWAEFNNGYAVNFSTPDTNEHIIIPSDLPRPNTGTIISYAEAPGNMAGTYGRILTNGIRSSINEGFNLGGDNGEFRSSAGDGASFDGLVSTGYTIGDWYLPATSYDGTNLKLFVDGTEKDSSNVFAGNIQYNAARPTAIGNMYALTDSWFGQIDNVMVLSRVVTADEQATMYNNQNSPATFYDLGNEQERTDVSSPSDTWSYTFSPGASGDYIIKTRGSNNDGVVEAPGSGITITVDMTTPSSAVSSPNNNATIGMNYTFAGTASDSGGGTVNNVEARIKTSGGTTVQDWTSVSDTGTNYSTWQYSYTFSNGGDYVIQKRATDSYGNVESIADSKNFTVDDALPTSKITSPQNNSKFSLEDITVEGIAQKNNGADVNRVQIKITKGSQQILGWTTVTPPNSKYSTWFYNLRTAQLSGQGEYKIYSRADNEIDNQESVGAPTQIYIDTTPPDKTAEIEAIPASAPALDRYMTVVNWPTSQDDQTKVVGYQVFRGEQQLVIKDQAGSVHGQALSTDKDTRFFVDDFDLGSHFYSVKAVDQAGNVSQASSASAELTAGDKAEIKEIVVEPSDKIEGEAENARTSAIVKYTTTAPASSYLEYGQGMLLTEEYADNKLNQTHLITLTDLKPGQLYSFVVKGIDENSNQIESGKQTFTAGSPQVDKSIVQIIIEAIRDAFDWMKRAMAATSSSNVFARVQGTKTESYLPPANQIKLFDVSDSDEYRVLVIYDPDYNLEKESGSINASSQSGTGYIIDTDLSKGQQVSYYLSGDPEGTKTSIIVGQENNISPEISNIANQQLAVSDEKADYLVTFNTDQPVQGTVSANNQTYTETGYNHSHAIVVSELEPGQVVNFTVKAETENGQTISSGQQSFVVSELVVAKPISQIIIDAILQAFNWLKSWFSK